MKGQRTLFDNLLQPTIVRKSLRGRSQQLIHKRDEKLMIRYFYHTEVKRLRFDDVLEVMSNEEFFIEPQTLINRLTRLSDKMTERFTERPSLAKLKEMCGNYVFDVTPKEKERYEKCF